MHLEALGEIAFEEASKRTKKGGKFTKNHQKWSKLAANISKCINVMRDCDAVKISQKLDKLRELVEYEHAIKF